MSRSAGWTDPQVRNGIATMVRSDVKAFAFVFAIGSAVAVAAALSLPQNPHGLFAFLAAELSLSVGVLAWWKGPDRAAARIFLWMCVCSAEYSFLLFGQYVFEDAEAVRKWTYMVCFGYYLFPASGLHFAFRLAGLATRRHRIALWAAYAASAFFLASTFAGFFPLKFAHTGVKWSLVLSPWYVAQLCFTGITLAAMLVELLLAFLTLPAGLKRTQVGWFLGASLVTVVLAFTNPLAATGLKAYPMGGIALALLSAVLAYLIVKHRFLDVQLVLRRTFFWAIWTSAVAGVYALLLAGLGLFLEVRPIEAQIPNLAALLLAAFLVLPLRTLVQNLVDRRFFRTRLDARRALEDLSAKVASLLSVEDLAREVLGTVSATFRADASLLLAAGPGKLGLAARSIPGRPFEFLPEERRALILPDGDWALHTLQLDPTLGVRPAGLPPEVSAFLGDSRIEVLLPLDSPEAPQGVLLLGVKASDLAYSVEELGFLRTVANGAAVALANARHHEDVLAMKNYTEDVMKSMESGLLTVDARGCIVSVNRAACAVLGLSEAAEGRPLAEVLPGEAVFREFVEKALRDGAAAGGADVPLDGRVLSLSSAPIHDHRGRQVGALASFLDVTETIRMRDALEQSRRLAAIGEMASRVAHEIKNPLASLKLVVSALDRRIDDPSYRSALLRIVPAEIDRLDRILRGLLDYARPVSLFAVPCDLASLLRSSIETLSAEIEKRGASLALDFEPSAPMILADGEKIKQVAINLVRNALDAMDGRTEHLLRISLRIASSGRVAFAVSDTGRGIPEDAATKLFQPFFSTKPDGTGLGLAVSRKIVESHGGTISADSPPGQGATFRVELPAAPANAEGGE